MASTLSPSAIHRVIFLVENDDRPRWEKEKNVHICKRPATWYPRADHCYADHMPSSRWKAIRKLYMGSKAAPPLDYLHSFELALFLKGEVSDSDVRDIFARGRPLEFWGCPRLLVSKIVETFRELQQEPKQLDVTVFALFGLGATIPSEAWPQVYTAYLPCHACTEVKTVNARSIPCQRNLKVEVLGSNVSFAVERFHVSSKSFSKQLSVELHYVLEEGTSEGEWEQSLAIHKVTIRLANEACSARGIWNAAANRSRVNTVFGFLERAHVGSSLLANRGLHDLIRRLKQRLPVHHLTCAFEEGSLGRRCERWSEGAYWLEIRHFQHDLSYNIVRRFQMPSAAGAENDCALIRHYLSNSYVADLQAPQADFPFAIKMLADLSRRNFSAGRVTLYAETTRLSDYSSMDVLFGYWTDRHLRVIERKLVQVCEEFERGKITDIVEHFQFTSKRKMQYAFSRDNMLFSGIRLEGLRRWDRINSFAWDVYRFRNDITGQYLTACVGLNFMFHITTLHILKGEAYPDASFADY